MKRCEHGNTTIEKEVHGRMSTEPFKLYANTSNEGAKTLYDTKGKSK